MARGRAGRKKVELGDEVYAKWPGSQMFYKGSVVMIDGLQDECLVKFDEESSFMLPGKDVYVSFLLFFSTLHTKLNSKETPICNI